MSTVLDVAIGVVFLYLLLALLATTVQEMFASVLGLRAANLYNAIESMLKGSFRLPGPDGQSDASASNAGKAEPSLDLVTQLYHHPLIKNLVQDPAKLAEQVKTRALSWTAKRRLPSYIPSKTFALALLDTLRGPGGVGLSATELVTRAHETIDRIGDEDLKRSLSLFVEKTATKAEDLEAQAERIVDGIEGWFNDRMARASGWYKRRAQVWSVAIAAVVVVLFNADSIHVSTRLWHDRALRDSLVASAEAYRLRADEPRSEKEPSAELIEQRDAIRDASFPIGWSWSAMLNRGDLAHPGPAGLCARVESDQKLPPAAREHCWDPSTGDYALLLAGWLITALAVSLGSNFWFDVLGKALQLRGSGPKVSVATGEVETKKG
jgi:hypothetical protein